VLIIFLVMVVVIMRNMKARHTISVIACINEMHMVMVVFV
jgi:hypothetical protein